MDQQQQSRELPTRGQVLWAVGVLVALLAVLGVLGYVYEWRWTGFVEDTAFHKKTLWDWLELLIIPLAIGAGTVWLNISQRQRELRDAARQRTLELDVQNQGAQDDALQSYLDYMSKVLVEDKSLVPYYGQATNEPASNERDFFMGQLQAVLRARTLAVLSRLGDSWRKVSVLQFLGESGLITKADTDESTVVPLDGAHLQGIVLAGPESQLDNTEFSHAILVNANLCDASLVSAYLNGAHLNEAYLNGANLSDAYLIGANLPGAHLNEANLTGADLTEANLMYADLSGAKGVTEEQLLATKSLEGATMPNGQKYAAWLKDKEGGGKDVENE